MFSANPWMTLNSADMTRLSARVGVTFATADASAMMIAAVSKKLFSSTAGAVAASVAAISAARA